MKIKAIITGTTGMVGEGVMHECLLSPEVEQVLVINRKPGGVTHPKLKEIIHANFHDLSAIEDQLKGYNACFFCAGVSSVGMNEADYTKVTYDLTLDFAKTLVRINPGMTFNYVSGASTDGSEKGNVMWARVKGKTENDLMKLPFKKVYAFRPAYMHPTPGLKNTLKLAKAFAWLYPLLKLFPKYVSTLSQVGVAMIKSVTIGYPKQVLEVTDIVALSKM
ncbi:MAG: NAD-dependent epimerase/dehydratase family protein [Bacteroidota bacterium]|nr:NAD-dependent epimerase/dehydratase family protein [Bacteroidota bacterium]